MILSAFVLSLIACFLQMFVFGAQIPILPFIPFVAIATLKAPFTRALFLAAAAGLFIDLLSADPFPIHAINYTLTALLSSRYKNRFSIEVPLQFALYTALCSFISTPLNVALLFLFDRSIPFQGKWLAAEWSLLPIFDALYALFWFAGPLALLRMAHRAWMVYWLKKKNPFPN